MFVYLFANISLIVLALISFIKTNKYKIALFVMGSFVILFIVSAFRGDFTADYKAYIYFFNYCKQFSLMQIFEVNSWHEIGYTWLNIAIGVISQNEVAIMIAYTLIILVLFYARFIKDSVYIWLSILMFVSIGPYYTSFNMMRQILAVAILFAAARFLYKNKIIKYFFVVLLASTIHMSALLMMPLGYLLVKFKPTRRNIMLLIPIIFILGLFLDNIMPVLGKIFFSSYILHSSYGMEAINIKILIVPMSAAIFALVYSKLININDKRYRVWLNAVIFYLIFALFAFQIKNFNRIAQYFLPYLYLIIPLEISRINKKDRLIYFILIPILLTLYVFVAFKGSGFDPYYFYWDN